MSSIRLEPGEAEAAEDSEFEVVRGLTEEPLIWRFVMKNRCDHPIDEIHICCEGIAPIRFRH